MADPKREQLNVQSQKAILIGVFDPQSPIPRENALDELRGLVKTAGVQIVGEMMQFRDKPHPAICVGRGKLEELKMLVEAKDAQLVVFDNNLTPSQSRALETELEKPIVDRSEVILDIFATHARTYEAMLQVELAQLMYYRTRLKRMWTHLERIQGGIGAGRGPGEKQLETDRRLIDRRISELKKKLSSVEKRRERTVDARRKQITVSLVGYTNAGKSTLMNALTDAAVLVQDKLFATLDTRTRRWDLSGFGPILLSDTVGFVRNLPHHLVASFRSTLEEARNADLLLHVVDGSNPQVEQQIETVYRVLEEIGVDVTNVLLVINKIDAVTDRSFVDVLRCRFENTVTISAAKGIGLDKLREAVASRLTKRHVIAEIETSVGNGKLFAYLHTHGEELDRTYGEDDRVTIRCRMPQEFAEAIDEQGTNVELSGDIPVDAAATQLRA